MSGNRCESDCRSRGREFDPGQVPYFRGDYEIISTVILLPSAESFKKQMWNHFEFGPVVQMFLKNYLELWGHLFWGAAFVLHAEQFCKIIFNLDQWFRCRLKDLSRAKVAHMFSGVEPFMQF